jgi:hypothetical protein
MIRDPNGNVQVLNTSAFKKLKEESREKGRKEAVGEFLSAMGYESADELRATLDKVRGMGAEQPPAEQPPAPEQPQNQQAKKGNNQNGQQAAYEREKSRMLAERDQLKGQLSREVHLKKEYQQRIDALEAEMTLRESAIRAGVVDIDYALRLLSRGLEGKSTEELEAFDENKFFTGLKDNHPYLFREQVKPANTGTGAGNAPAGLKPGEIAQGQAQNQQFDARKATPEQVRERLAARGLNLTI